MILINRLNELRKKARLRSALTKEDVDKRVLMYSVRVANLQEVFTGTELNELDKIEQKRTEKQSTSKYKHGLYYRKNTCNL